MTVQIDTTAEIDGVRLVQQGSHPATPDAGHSIVYLVSGTPSGGLYVKDDQGRQIGPFITGSAAVAPGSGALIFLNAFTVTTGSATIDFTTEISSTYDEYIIELVGLAPVSNGVDFYMRVGATGTFDTGSNYVSNNYLQASSGNTSAVTTAAQFVTRNAGEISNGAGKTVNGTMKLYTPSGIYKQLLGSIFWQGGSNYIHNITNWIYLLSAPITSMRFYFSSGNIASGTIRIYGISKT
jgi:hypothetical protein